MAKIVFWHLARRLRSCSTDSDRNLKGNRHWRDSWKRETEICTGKMTLYSALKLNLTGARTLLMIHAGENNRF